MNTNFLTPGSVISNGVVTGNEWSTPYNIFLVDQEYAISNGTSDFTIGNFNFNLPVGSVINGFEIEVIGYRGAQTSPVITLDVSAYNNVNGADDYYAYPTPITSLTETESTITIGSPTFLFSRVWTVDEVNNLKLNFTANGDISLDCVLVKVYYTGPATNTLNYNTLTGTFQVGETVTDTITGATAEIVTDNGSDSMTVTNVVGYFQNGDSIEGGTSGATALLNAPIPGVCIDCSSPIQVQAMYLELPFLIGDTKFYLKKGSFSYPNGVPVQPGDIGSCGGTIPFVFDESKRKIDGGNFEENAMLDTNNGGTWTVLSSGVIEVDLGSVNQRGLDYKTPAGHVASNMSDHDANSKVIISNNEPYNLTLVRRCQEGTLFSAPITAQDEGINLTTYLKKVNFVGAGVAATLTGTGEIEVNIPGGGSGGQAAIQFEDDGTNLGTPGTVTEVDFTGTGVTASRATNKITVNIPGGGAGGIASINGDSTSAQLLTNTDTLIDITQPVAGTNEFAINTTNLGNDTNLINTITNNATFQLNVNNFVSGGSGGGTKLAIDTTSTSINTGLQTLFTIPIPGGTLGTNNAIRFKILCSSLFADSTNKTITINALYGGTNIGTVTLSGGSSQITSTSGVVEGYIIANNSTALQKGSLSFVSTTDGADNTSVDTDYGTSVEDSTVSQDLVITGILTNNSTCTTEAIIVESISGISGGTIISATAGQDLVAGNPVGVSFLDDNTVAIANTTYLEQALGFTPDITDTIQIDTDKIAILYGDGGTNLYVIVGTLDKASMTFTFGTPALVDADLGSTNSIHKLDTNKFAVLYNTTSTEKQVRLVGATVVTNTITLGTSVLLFTSADTIQDGIHSIQNGTDRGVMFTVDNSLNQKVIAYTFSGTVPTAGSSVTVDINNGGSGIGSKFRMALIATDKFVVSSWNKANVCTVSTNTITAGTGVAFTGNTASGSIWCWKVFSPTTDVFIVGVNESNNRNLYVATVSGTVPTFGSLYALGSEQQMFGLSATEVLLNGTDKLTISGTSVVSNTQIYQYTLTGTQVDMLNGTWWGITASGSNLQYFVTGMSQNFMGIAQNTVALNGTVQVLIKGKDNNQSGLNAGNLYSFSGTTLVLNASGNVRALSATEVII
jgi:hypothetical protein